MVGRLIFVCLVCADIVHKAAVSPVDTLSVIVVDALIVADHIRAFLLQDCVPAAALLKGFQNRIGIICGGGRGLSSDAEAHLPFPDIIVGIGE